MNSHVSPDLIAAQRDSAIELEQALIGACMNYPTAILAAMGNVEANHFRDDVHKVLWSAMIEIASAGRLLNPVTLGAKLGNDKISDIWTMRQYIAHCAATTYCPANAVVDFARQVREFAVMRRVMEITRDAASMAVMTGAEPRQLIAEVMQDLDETRAELDGRGARTRTIADGAAALVDRETRTRAGEVVEQSISTGIRALDHKLHGGFKPGELIVIAGRPGMGKTTVAVSCARQMAKHHGGAFFSLEMPERQISARFMSDEIFDDEFRALSASQILQGNLRDEDFERVVEAERGFRKLPLYLDYSPMLTVGELSARARVFGQRLERDGRKLEFVIIDYLKFLRASERYRGQRHYEIGEITAGLKGLAKDLGIPVVLLAQLNREVEKTADRRPELSHLRESGDIEADADVVMFLFREAYYLANDPRLNTDPEIMGRLELCKHRLEIIIAKQRMGAVCKVDVFCHPGASAIRDLQ